MRLFPLIAFLCGAHFLAGTQSFGRVQQMGMESSRSTAALSDRIASYRIDVRLDPEAKTVKGYEVLTWKNLSGVDVNEFCFHLYLNAFKNNRSTFVRERGFRSFWEVDGEVPEDYWGYTRLESIEVLGDDGAPAPKIIESSHAQPDDDNAADETVLMFQLDKTLKAGQTIRFRIDFTSKLPRAARRTGWAPDYFLVAQWFPKIGVFQDGTWNCHQYHQTTEYFADYGVYEVSLTVPEDFVVGATGKRIDHRNNQDGTATYHYYQEDVHDFAWTASPRFVEKERVFTDPELPQVKITLLLLPEHAYLEERYFLATEHALRYYGRWFGAYPYDNLTVVDPAYRSNTGGMEYPTFVTGRATYWSPGGVLSPESVTVHEVGHQWWYGLVANNEFEEAWLDEGINSWSESRVLKHAYGPDHFIMRFFGGVPHVFESVKIPQETAALSRVRQGGKSDVMAREGWKYRERSSYLVNSYSKPEMVLWTLERWLGEELMLKGMRTYFHRYRFKHPTTRDFIATINEAAERDMNWFFDETFFSSELVDYAVSSVVSKPLPDQEGVFDDSAVEEEEEETHDTYWTEVVVRRLEGAKFPVDVLMVFEDGEEVVRQWDGRDRWQRFVIEGPVRLNYAVVDPKRKLLLDIDPTNNSRYARLPEGYALATKKWASKWLFWLQNLLEMFAFVG